MVRLDLHHRVAALLMALSAPLLTGAKENGCSSADAAGGIETLSAAGGCVVSGCSGQVCAEKPMMTTCEWREEYACYQRYGVCARGRDGACGWQETPALTRCLAESSVAHEPAGAGSP